MAADPVMLVVDDDPAVRQVLVRALELDGMIVVEADGGREALRILQRDPSICVMVTDIMMPGISGVTLAQRATELRPDVETVLVTAYAPAYLVQGRNGDLNCADTWLRIIEVIGRRREPATEA